MKKYWEIKGDILYIHPLPKRNRKNGIKLTYTSSKEWEETHSTYEYPVMTTDIFKGQIEYQLPPNFIEHVLSIKNLELKY